MLLLFAPILLFGVHFLRLHVIEEKPTDKLKKLKSHLQQHFFWQNDTKEKQSKLKIRANACLEQQNQTGGQ